jgi:hypothetical protein
MRRDEIEKLREAVSCASVLEQAGFAVDLKESTRRAVKFRRGAEIMIVTHESRGWFDPLSDDKGDVFALACLLEHLGFSEAVVRVGELVRCKAAPILWKKPLSKVEPADILARWQARRLPATGSGRVAVSLLVACRPVFHPALCNCTRDRPQRPVRQHVGCPYR